MFSIRKYKARLQQHAWTLITRSNYSGSQKAWAGAHWVLLFPSINSIPHHKDSIAWFSNIHYVWYTPFAFYWCSAWHHHNLHQSVCGGSLSYFWASVKRQRWHKKQRVLPSSCFGIHAIILGLLISWMQGWFRSEQWYLEFLRLTATCPAKFSGLKMKEKLEERPFPPSYMLVKPNSCKIAAGCQGNKEQ